MVSRGKDSAHSHPFSIVRVPEVPFITEHFPLCDFYILFILTEVKQSGDLPSIASTLLSGGPHHLHLLWGIALTPFVLGEAAKCWGLMNGRPMCFRGVWGVSTHLLTVWSVREQNPQLLESFYFLRHIGTKEEGFTWGHGFRGDIHSYCERQSCGSCSVYGVRACLIEARNVLAQAAVWKHG